VYGRHVDAPGEAYTPIERVAFTPTPHGWPRNVIVRGDQVLLSNGETYAGLQRIDWRQPKTPRLAQSFDVGNFGRNAIVLAGTAAYVTDSFYGVRRMDLTQPDRPAPVSLYMSAGEIQQLLIDPPLALANLEWGGTVAILDVSDPLHIRIRGYYRPGHFDDYAVALSGHYFYYGKHRERRIIDVEHPARMNLLGTYHEQGIGRKAAYHWQGSGRRAALAGDALYIIQGSEALDTPRIAVVDVSRPRQMHKVFITPETPPAFQDDWFDERLLHQGDMLGDMFVRGHFLYVSDYWGGVRVYDCRIPFHPELRDWEFRPYLALMPKNWSKPDYARAVASGKLHEALNIGGFSGNYLLQPKLGGIAVYRVPMSP